MKIRFLFFCLSLVLGCREGKEAIKPSIHTITESVYATVTVQPANMYHLSSAIPGVIDKIYVEEGDSISKGQLIARIIATGPSINMENALETARFANERYLGESTVLHSLAEEIKISREQRVLDSVNYHRQKRLWSKNIGSRAEFEAKEIKYKLSQNKLIQLKQKLAQTNLELKNNQIQSQNALKLAQLNLSDHRILASANGRVYALLKREGELISLQETLAQLGSADDFILEMFVDEVDIARIGADQNVLITLDAYPDQLFEANIDKIYPLKDARTQTFKIEAKFKKPPSVLYGGLSGEANIVIDNRREVVTIPLAYLQEDDKVLTENGVKSVKVGIRTLDYTEIIEGIDTSILILMP